MEPDSRTLAAQDNTQLHFLRWPAARDPRLVMVVSPGHGEHAGRYGELADHFAARGAVIYAIDHRGHGRSGGPRGHVRNFESYARDLRQLVDLAHSENSGLPLVLLGHSWGGAIAILYAQMFPDTLDAAVFSSPMLRVRMSVPKWKVAMGRFLGRVYPTFHLPTGLDASHLSHDEEVVQAYRTDPLVHDQMSAGAYNAWLDATPRLMAAAGDLRVPFLILHGEDDPVLDPEASRQFAARARVSGAQLRTYPEMLHEPFNEIGKERVFHDVEQYLTEVLRQRTDTARRERKSRLAETAEVAATRAAAAQPEMAEDPVRDKVAAAVAGAAEPARALSEPSREAVIAPGGEVTEEKEAASPAASLSRLARAARTPLSPETAPIIESVPIDIRTTLVAASASPARGASRARRPLSVAAPAEEIVEERKAPGRVRKAVAKPAAAAGRSPKSPATKTTAKAKSGARSTAKRAASPARTAASRTAKPAAKAKSTARAAASKAKSAVRTAASKAKSAARTAKGTAAKTTKRAKTTTARAKPAVKKTASAPRKQAGAIKKPATTAKRTAVRAKTAGKRTATTAKKTTTRATASTRPAAKRTTAAKRSSGPANRAGASSKRTTKKSTQSTGSKPRARR